MLTNLNQNEVDTLQLIFSFIFKEYYNNIDRNKKPSSVEQNTRVLIDTTQIYFLFVKNYQDFQGLGAINHKNDFLNKLIAIISRFIEPYDTQYVKKGAFTESIYQALGVLGSLDDKPTEDKLLQQKFEVVFYWIKAIIEPSMQKTSQSCSSQLPTSEHKEKNLSPIMAKIINNNQAIAMQEKTPNSPFFMAPKIGDINPVATNALQQSQHIPPFKKG
ncbi:MAG: hypothetical protein K2Q14_00080 [Gammaproteobacteria bacterium]|nr:hypothetical protein [Gammaproteobacteria bacterium]